MHVLDYFSDKLEKVQASSVTRCQKIVMYTRHWIKMEEAVLLVQ